MATVELPLDVEWALNDSLFRSMASGTGLQAALRDRLPDGWWCASMTTRRHPLMVYIYLRRFGDRGTYRVVWEL